MMADEAKSPSEQEEEARRQILLQRGLQEISFSIDFLKWAIASLQILNGGAIVAFIGNDQTRRLMFTGPGWCFAAGLLGSILTGVFIAKFYENTSSQLLHRLWRGGSLSQEPYGLIYGSTKTLPSLALAGLFGVASFVLFIVGCWIVSSSSEM